MEFNRRSFLRAGLGAGMGVGLGLSKAAAGEAGPEGWTIGAFEKIFQTLGYEEMGRQLAALGFQGIEATVRKGGHIDPARAAEELPQAVEDLKKHHCKILVMASSINRADDKGAEDLLRMAKGLGVTRYRMEYYMYSKDVSPKRQVEEFKAQARDLAAMNRGIGVQAVYQNHAGASRLGGALWDLDLVLDGIPKEEIGVALDLRHAVVESGLSWERGFALLRPRVAMVYVKDSLWKGTVPENVPLGTGVVTKKVFQEAVRGIGKVPVSLHVEYFGGTPLAVDKLEPVMAAHGRDLQTLRGWL